MAYQRIEDLPLATEILYFQANQAEPQKQYPGQYVAIIGEEVVDSDPTLPGLAERVYRHFGRRAILMQHVDMRERVVRMGGPRRVARE